MGQTMWDESKWKNETNYLERREYLFRIIDLSNYFKPQKNYVVNLQFYPLIKIEKNFSLLSCPHFGLQTISTQHVHS